jgi:phosphoribosylanthranilate isomerase
MPKKPKIIKAFSVDENFDFGSLTEYEAVCDYFLFDTKGKNPGGNGQVFDWRLLKNYLGDKPVFLSGGIGPESVRLINELDLPIFAIDINSRFETEPGIKNASAIARFKNELI